MSGPARADASLRGPTPVVQVALEPADSPLAPRIAEAAEACGATFVTDHNPPGDLTVRVWVVDHAAGGTRTGPEVLAGGDDPAAWDSVGADDPRLLRALKNLVEAAQRRAA